MRYFYYKIYKLLLNKDNTNDPVLHALVLLIVLQGLNVYSIIDIIDYFVKLEIYSNLNVLCGLILFVTLLVPNYIYIFRNHNEIIKRYKNEAREDRIWGFIGLLLYVLVSITVFFVLGETLK